METANKTLHVVKDVLKDVLGKEISIEMNAEFESIGLNSITFIYVIVALEDQYGIEFEDEYLDYAKYQTVTDFCMYVDKLLQAH